MIEGGDAVCLFLFVNIYIIYRYSIRLDNKIYLLDYKNHIEKKRRRGMGGQRREGRKKRSRIRTAESSHRFDR